MRKLILFTGVLVLFLSLNSCKILASELEDYDFSGVENYLQTEENTGDISFSDLVKELISGNTDGFFEQLGEKVYSVFFEEINDNRHLVKRLVIISIIGACFSNISGVFKNGQVGETGFYVTYMIVVSLSVGSFYIAVNIAREIIGSVMEFMQVLLPTMMMSVAVSSGSVSAIGFYELVLLIISLINYVVLNIIVPGIVIYVMICFVNNSFKDEKLSKLAGLVKTGIRFATKSMYTAIIGINVIKSMLLPYVDSVKESAFLKTIEAIPGVGDSVSSTASVMIGTSNLIKNGIGTAALIVIIIMCSVPLVKLGAMVLMHKFISVIIEPVSDKRIVELQECISEGISMVLSAVFMVMMLFLITIAIVCMCTNVNYYSGS